MDYKPREEQSYKSLYPGLSAKRKLTLDNPKYKEYQERIRKDSTEEEHKVEHDSPNTFTGEKRSKTSKAKHRDDLTRIEYCLTDTDHDFLSKYLENNRVFAQRYGMFVVDLFELVGDRIVKEWRYFQYKLIHEYYKNDREVNKDDDNNCEEDLLEENKKLEEDLNEVKNDELKDDEIKNNELKDKLKEEEYKEEELKDDELTDNNKYKVKLKLNTEQSENTTKRSITTNNNENILQDCSICALSTESPQNTLLTYNGCSITIHQECYGVPNLEKYTTIPNLNHSFYYLDSLWFCRKCLFSSDVVLKCKYCPNTGGAYKQVYATRKWGHVLCAKFLESGSFANLVFLEPIEELTKNNMQKCMLCRNGKGRTMCCAYKKCEFSFHVTCGINSGLYFDMKNVIAYCSKHDPENKKIESLNSDSFTKLNTLVQEYKKPDYPKLKHRPIPKKGTKLETVNETFIMKVKSMRPRFTEFIANRIMANDLHNLMTREMYDFVVAVGMYFNVAKKESVDFLSGDCRKWSEWNGERKIVCFEERMDYEKGFYIAELVGKCFNDNEDNDVLNIRRVYSGKKKNNDDFIRNAEKSLEKQIQINKKNSRFKNDKLVHGKFLEILSLNCPNIHYDNIINFQDIKNICEALKALRNIITKFIEQKECAINILKIKPTCFRMQNDVELYKMEKMLDELRSVEEFDVFEYPVDEMDAPGYYGIVKRPMCFAWIEERMGDWEGFVKMLRLVVGNCRVYNEGNRYYEGLAGRLERRIGELVVKYANWRNKTSSKSINDKMKSIFGK